jgi:hypothetical protein
LIKKISTGNDDTCDLALCYFLLTIKLIAGLFVKGCSPAALFIALGFGELNFSPESALSTPYIPLTLSLITVDKRKRRGIAVVEIDFAAGK